MVSGGLEVPCHSCMQSQSYDHDDSGILDLLGFIRRGQSFLEKPQRLGIMCGRDVGFDRLIEEEIDVDLTSQGSGVQVSSVRCQRLHHSTGALVEGNARF